MPNYDKSTRKFGDGYTFWAVHAVAGDESGSPFDGEVSLATLIAQANAAGDSLKGYSTASEIGLETEIIEDRITQEAAAVQNKPVTIANTFKIMMSHGNATNLAISLGLIAATDETDVLGAGDDADTVVWGLREPEEISLLHRIKNSQVSALWYDYYYMPRVTVNPSFTLTLNQNTVRNVEITFNLQPSHQDGTDSGVTTSEDLYIDQSDTFGTLKSYYQTST